MVEQVSQDFELFKGDSKDLPVTVCDKNGDVVDITDATIRWWAGKREATGEVVIQKDIGSPGGIVITDAVGGKFTITLDPVDTINLTDKFLYHEAEILDNTGRSTTIMFGIIELRDSLISQI